MAELYASVNGQGRKVTKLYGSVDGKTKEIKRVYGSVGGVAKIVYDTATAPTTGDFGAVYYQTASGETLSVGILTQAEFNSLGQNSNGDWSVTLGGGTVTVNSQSYPVIVGIEIKKTSTIPNGFLKGCNKFNWEFTLPNAVTRLGNDFLYGCTSFNKALRLSNIKTVGDNFLYNCTSLNTVVSFGSVDSVGSGFMRNCSKYNQAHAFGNYHLPDSIGDYFMSGCTAFNQPLNFRLGAETIGDHFLRGCTSFNSAITNNDNTESIGSYFMYDCTKFNQPLTLYATTKVGTYFMHNCNAYTNTLTVRCDPPSDNYSLATSSSSAACYTTGITVAGTKASAWKTALPNRTSSPYRKLL